MKLERVLLESTIFLVFIGCTDAIYWQSDVPIVYESDCNPRCDKGQHCVYNIYTKKPACTCPQGKYFVENQGCQKLFQCPLCVNVNPWGVVQEMPVPTDHGIVNRKYYKCNPGYYYDPERIVCRRANECDTNKKTCPQGQKCIAVEGGPKGTKELRCVKEDRYIPKEEPKEIITCKTGGDQRCIEPAKCYDVINKNADRTFVCSCPPDKYLTRNMRQCSEMRTLDDNKVYSITLKDNNKKFPDKFKIYLDGCFNVEVNKAENTIIYQAVDTISPIKTNFNIDNDFKSIHFEMKAKTLNIFTGNEKLNNENTQYEKLRPIFSIKFERVGCKFIESIEGLEDGNDIIRTESTMRDHPTL